MPTYYTLVTNAGLAKIAAAIANGSTVDLYEMAVGDGNGNPTTPSQSQTGLVRERFRAQISNMQVDPVNPNRFVVDVQVPMGIGGWSIHEVGVFDATGTMIAVANFPPTYKPLPTEGSARDLTVRVYMEVSNASVVTVTVNPAVVIASQAWVADNYSLAALIPGGTNGQVLTKKTNASGVVEWKNPTDLTVIVDAIPEEQTLTAGQTVVSLANCTTTGLAVYIEGVRLHSFTVNSISQITLPQSYPTGTKVLFVQNDPLNSVGGTDVGDIVVVQDMGDGTTGLPDLDGRNLRNTPPPGTMAVFSRFDPPVGWLLCDGSAVSRTTYSRLFDGMTKQTTGDLTSGSNSVPNVGSTVRVKTGMVVEGPGIPNGTTITAISGNEFILSQNVGATHVGASLRIFAQGNGNGTNTFNLPNAHVSPGVPFITCVKF